MLGMHGFGLEVPDFEVAERYFTTFGLALRSRGDCLVFGSQGRDQDEVVISAGPRKRLHHVAFTVNPGDMAQFRALLHTRNINFQEDVPRGGYRKGLWFMDPWGTWVNLVPGVPAPSRAVAPPARRDFLYECRREPDEADRPRGVTFEPRPYDQGRHHGARTGHAYA